MKYRSLPANTSVATLVDLLRDRANGHCADRGFTFFRGDDLDDEWLRYRQLHDAAENIAAAIDAETAPQKEERSAVFESRPGAVILCPPGPSYLKALFGALYARVIAVTAYPPRARRRDERLDRVIDDSNASIALVDETIFDRREQILKSSPALGRLRWINVDRMSSVSGSNRIDQENDPDSVAVLQYTSGSTSDPKGVCLTHRNLLSNLRMIYESFEVQQYGDRWSVTWLPPYHDMGLIGGLLQVIYAGECCHVLPPASFVQKPVRWLRAISKYKASVSGGPNFAYDACVDRVTDEERDTLDLSHWTLAFTGAEPIRAGSLDRFADAFATTGFRRSSFFPCYGLAEATLMVTGGPRSADPRTNPGPRVATASSVHTTSGFVSCGRVVAGQKLRIVDPKTNARLPDGCAGEVWVSGDNVSPGYWQAPEVNHHVFNHSLEGEADKFLRTGDLGYIDDGELFVCGRLKELIVVRGRNFQPSDIEATVEENIAQCVPNACAAFEVEAEGETGLAVALEVERHRAEDRADIAFRVMQCVSETFDLQPARVILLAKRALPKTSSGKVKRLTTRQLYEQGELGELLIDQRPVSRETPLSQPGAFPIRSDEPCSPQTTERGRDEISRWLVQRIAEQLSVDRRTIDISRPFIRYGLDSVSAVQIASELESFLGREIPATLLYEAPTIDAVARRLSSTDQTDAELAVRSRGLEPPRIHDIAIIGVACRLPGCKDVAEFWHLLRQAQTAISDPPLSRRKCVSDHAVTQRAGWIEDPDLFDAALFGISPREARYIDPQHRMVLETSWRAIEDAGIDPRRLAGTTTAAYVGLSNRDYERLMLRNRNTLSAYAMTGNAASMSAHRLSYHLDLRGPSVAVDTACSSSLVAVHQAIRAIQMGDCDQAIVAGVNLILSPEVSNTLSDAEMLSPTGLCKTFDAAADGYARGEGCIAMLLKPLPDAIGDGDRIRAVIRGSAINQDGMTNGITAPNGDSQIRLYRRALSDASLRPADVTLLEAHGTGTSLGDPIEVQSLKEVYGPVSTIHRPCHLGAVKANIGHLEAAAGLASLLKVVLELEHRETAPQPNLSEVNPHIDLNRSRVVIPVERSSWESSEPRTAAVSSFGFGGTNAHVIVSEYRNESQAAVQQHVSIASSVAQKSPCLITLSAAHPQSLRDLAAAHARAIDDSGDDWQHVVLATHKQKTSQRHRLAIVGESSEMLGNRLRQFALGESSPTVHFGTAPADRPPSIAFLFSGQGGQHVGMGRGLYQQSETFRSWVDRCDDLLEKEFGYRIRDVIRSETGTNGAVAQILEGPGSQTGLFVLQLALAKTLNGWGIRSTVVSGHSMGEYAAAAMSDVMDWQDALRLTATRAGRVAELKSDGMMAVVFADVESIEDRLRTMEDDVSIAAIDGPTHVVVSGSVRGIESLTKKLNRYGTKTKPLRITHAFHSRWVEPVLGAIGETVSGFSLRRPNQAFVSTLSGSKVSEELQSPDYWVQQTRRPVQFVAALETLQDLDCDLVVEVGPHTTLCTLGQLNPHVDLNYCPTLRRGVNDWQSIYSTLAQHYVHGCEVDWDEVDKSKVTRPRVILPGHPFRSKRFWIEVSETIQNEPQRTGKIKTSVVTAHLESNRRARQSQSDASKVRGDLSRFAAALTDVDKTVVSFMWDALCNLNAGLSVGDSVVPSDMVSRGTVATQYLRLLTRMCEILEDEGVLQSVDSADPGDQPRSWTLARPLPESMQSTPTTGDTLTVGECERRLVDRCGSSLPDVLRGTLDPLSVLFPNGDASDLESLYRASPIAKVSNQLVAETARAVVETQSRLGRSTRTGLRVLEIGAGTGGTTSHVVPAIGKSIETYLFTDASPLLISDSATRFGSMDVIEYRKLDIEADPAEQGFETGSFDLVIAANVLHATRDLRTSLTHARRLLRSDGFLIALEGVRAERFLDLVFGITEGWWRYRDFELRPNYPLVSEATWIDLLQQCGFDSPVAIPYPPEGELVRPYQTVLLAGAGNRDQDRNDGLADESSMRESLDVPPTVTSVDRQWIDAFHRSPRQDRAKALTDYVRHAVSAVSGLDADDLDLDQPVNNLGIDSLMAIQLKNRLESDLGLSVPMIVFLEGRSVRGLIEVALEQEEDGHQSADHAPALDASPSALSERTRDAVPAMVTAAAAAQPSIAGPSDDSVTARIGESQRASETVLGPLSAGQLALWMIHQRAPMGPAYNFAFAAKTSHSIDQEAMTKACRALVKRHPDLRTFYRLDGKNPVRVLSHSAEVNVEVKDCRDWSDSQILDSIREEADRPFDLQHGPVIRFSLVRCGSGDVLSIAMHHIAADLWSMDILIREWVEIYGRISNGESFEFASLPATYDDYVNWEQSLEDSEEGERLWRFWREKLDGAPQVLALPTTYKRPAEQTFQGRSVEWTLAPNVVDALRNIANSERTTLFATVLSAYQVFLARVCDQEDLLVGTVSASRGRSEWEGIVGYFLNHLILRSRIVGSPSFRQVLRDSQREVLDALSNQAFPFAKLVEKMRPVRDASRTPLVQTMFIWDKPRNLKASQIGAQESGECLRLEPWLMEQRGAPFDLTLIVFEIEDELRLTFRYNSDLFSQEAIKSLSGSLATLIESLAGDPDVPVRTASMLPPEQEAAIRRWNATDMPFDPSMSGYALFQQHAKRTPQAIAIEADDQTLSYAQADERAADVCRHLRAHSVGRGHTVALLLPRGVDAIVAMLGVWKAGAAYLPLDPDHPTSRLKAICDDANPDALLCGAESIERHPSIASCPMIDLQVCFQRAEPTAPVTDIVVDPDAPAYVIYTSGSTGKPKGVVLRHRGLANLAMAQHLTFSVSSKDRCLQLASLGFDASVFEIMMAFHAGACLFVLDSSVLRSTTTEAAAAIRLSRVNIATLSPSVLAAIPSDNLPDLHTVVSAGEACSSSLVKKWAEGRRFFNAYGPTEATVWATTQLCRGDSGEPSLGRPIPNVHIDVVDTNLQRLPVGVPGELCLSGPGLALEYRNNPSATATAFVPNPFDDRFDATLYRTGDRARWNEHGDLEFLGRIDDQVKVDGNRIEPGEIASLMRQTPGVRDAVVTTGSHSTSTDSTGVRLTGYFIPDANLPAEMDVAAMRRHLAAHLPCYMLPKDLMAVPSFPLTSSGKVDVSKLPSPSGVNREAIAVPVSPRTETESVLADIWKDVLQLNVVGVHDNFFDLGGASLQALQAADQATRRGLVISAERMFQFQTIAELATEIDLAAAASESSELTERTVVREVGGDDPQTLSGATPQVHPTMVEHSSKRERSCRMVIESIGTYLPPDIVSTAEIIDGCRRPLDFPLEKMTGIESRRMAGREEFSIDLARQAADDCIRRSRFRAGDIDLLIACNISRYDGPDFAISYEPSTASKLKQVLGANSAVAFDVCNACAGFFTALAVAEARLLSGESRCAMVVSGEYITHLTKTAQDEVDGFLDPRLACLTLGDAGAAVIVELSDSGFGFESLDLYTAGRHHELCVAKVTEKPGGGAIMLTDAIKASAVTLEHSVKHAHSVVDASPWSVDDVGHVIMHQTSTTTLDGAIEELNRYFGRPVCNRQNAVNNLRSRGNTASTTHWVAVNDMIQQGRISSGEKVVFAISGSGQTIGTALYRFDDLPERMRSEEDSSFLPSSATKPAKRTFGVRIVAASIDEAGPTAGDVPKYSDYQVVESAARATDSVLRFADWDVAEVELLIHAGVYRDHFLSEPAVASILAGELKMNDGLPHQGSHRTLAFDLADGACGPLDACGVVSSMIRCGRIERGIVTASELENNLPMHDQRGVAPMGSAIALERADRPDVGLGEFFFRSYPQYAEKLSTKTGYRDGRPCLVVQRSDDLDQVLIESVGDCVAAFLAASGQELGDFQKVLLSLPATIDRSLVENTIGVASDQLVLPTAVEGDAFTSGIAVMWRLLEEEGADCQGEKWLMIAAGAGIEVVCAEYTH